MLDKEHPQLKKNFQSVNLFQCRCAQVIVDTFLDTIWNIYVFWICLKKCWKTGYSQGSQIEVFRSLY
jgi:hypothetical protein